MKRLLSELGLFVIAMGVVYLMYWTLSKLLTLLFD